MIRSVGPVKKRLAKACEKAAMKKRTWATQTLAAEVDDGALPTNGKASVISLPMDKPKARTRKAKPYGSRRKTLQKEVPHGKMDAKQHLKEARLWAAQIMQKQKAPRKHKTQEQWAALQRELD